MTEKDARKIAKRLLKEMDERAGKPEAMEMQKLHSYPWVGVIPASQQKESEKS